MSVRNAVDSWQVCVRASLTRVGVCSVMVSKATRCLRRLIARSGLVAGSGRVVPMNATQSFAALRVPTPRLGSPMAVPEVDEAIEVNVATGENLPWMCIVWDDPVILMSYVAYVFQTVLGYDRKRANELMMQVHTEGKAVVSTGEKDKVEGDVKKLHTAGLWATMQQAG